MKIVHLINTLSAGGAELHLLTLCRHLRRQEVDVVVACLREQAKDSRPLRKDFECEGIRVVDLHAASRYDVGYPARVFRLVDEERPDILHTHLPRADLAGALVRARRRSARWVCSVHDLHNEAWFGRWLLPLVHGAWRRADAVIAISDAVKDLLVRKAGVPSEKLTRIYYGIESESFRTPNTLFRKEWNLNGDFVIGTVGRLEPRKGHQILIRAMRNVLKEIPNAVLLIAGHDPWGYGGRLRAQVSAFGLSKRVKFLGFQTDVPSFLHALDLFALASSAEGFGQVLVEAMAAGKSVVTTKIAPLTEIVADEETGLLVRPGDAAAFNDAIVWLYKHPEEMQEMGRRGAGRVRSMFTATRMSDETMALYRSLRS